MPANVEHSAEFEVDTDEIEFWFMNSLIKNKTKRLLVGIFLPILLGSLGLCISILTDSRITLSTELNEWFKQVVIDALIPVLIYAAALGGIQTIIYSFLMEKHINPKIKSHLLVIIISATLGVMSTLLSGFVTQHYMLYSIIGGVTGIIVGAILRKMYINERQLHNML